MAKKLAAKGVAAMAAALEAGASKDEAAAAGAAAMLAAAQGVVFFSPQGAASTIVEEVAAPIAAEAPRVPVGEQPHEASGAEAGAVAASGVDGYGTGSPTSEDIDIDDATMADELMAMMTPSPTPPQKKTRVAPPPPPAPVRTIFSAPGRAPRPIRGSAGRPAPDGLQCGQAAADPVPVPAAPVIVPVTVAAGGNLVDGLSGGVSDAPAVSAVPVVKAAPPKRPVIIIELDKTKPQATATTRTSAASRVSSGSTISGSSGPVILTARVDKPRDDKAAGGKPKVDKPKVDKPKADKPKVDKPKVDKQQVDFVGQVAPEGGIFEHWHCVKVGMFLRKHRQNSWTWLQELVEHTGFEPALCASIVADDECYRYETRNVIIEGRRCEDQRQVRALDKCDRVKARIAAGKNAGKTAAGNTTTLAADVAVNRSAKRPATEAPENAAAAKADRRGQSSSSGLTGAQYDRAGERPAVVLPATAGVAPKKHLRSRSRSPDRSRAAGGRGGRGGRGRVGGGNAHTHVRRLERLHRQDRARIAEEVAARSPTAHVEAPQAEFSRSTCLCLRRTAPRRLW